MDSCPELSLLAPVDTPLPLPKIKWTWKSLTLWAPQACRVSGSLQVHTAGVAVYTLAFPMHHFPLDFPPFSPHWMSPTLEHHALSACFIPGSATAPISPWNHPPLFPGSAPLGPVPPHGPWIRHASQSRPWIRHASQSRPWIHHASQSRPWIRHASQSRPWIRRGALC